jgi:hypothetical protein
MALRLHYFDAMSHDLSSVVPTKDHVLAKALGGRKQVLTCKKCNSEAGHKIQGHLNKLFVINEGFRGSADSGGWRSAFRSDGDQYSEAMAIGIPN